MNRIIMSELVAGVQGGVDRVLSGRDPATKAPAVMRSCSAARRSPDHRRVELCAADTRFDSSARPRRARAQHDLGRDHHRARRSFSGQSRADRRAERRLREHIPRPARITRARRRGSPGGRGAFVVVHRGGVPVGCGAIRRLDDETAELKRRYVAPVARAPASGADSSRRSRPKRGARRAEARARDGVRQEAARAVSGDRLPPHSALRRVPPLPETSVCLGKDVPC
jgi:hypothetical protein